MYLTCTNGLADRKPLSWGYATRLMFKELPVEVDVVNSLSLKCVRPVETPPPPCGRPRGRVYFIPALRPAGPTGRAAGGAGEP